MRGFFEIFRVVCNPAQSLCKLFKNNQISTILKEEKMRSVKSFPIILAAVVFIAVFGGQSRADFPEYTSQDSCSTNYHSGIDTSDGKVVWDSAFAWMVTNPLGAH